MDVFSYASVLYELTHCKSPFCDGLPPDMHPNALYNAVTEMTLSGQRPQLDSTVCPESMCMLIKVCRVTAQGSTVWQIPRLLEVSVLRGLNVPCGGGGNVE